MSNCAYDSRAVPTIVLCVAAGLAMQAAPAAPGKSSAAEEFQAGALSRKVLNLDSAFHWIEGTDRFWFRRQTGPDDGEIVVVDAATGRQSVLMSDATLLSVAKPSSASAPKPAVAKLAFEDRGARVVVDTTNGTFSCGVPVRHCERQASPPGPDLVVAPNRANAVFLRGDNLWLRELASGAERQLTRDGEPSFGYGDLDRWEDLDQVARRRNKLATPLRGVLWSPDGRFIVALRQDMRPIPERLLVAEYVPPDKGDAQVHMRRVATARDARRPDSHLVVIDTKTWEVRKALLDTQALNDWAFGYFITGVVWWSGDNETLYLIGANRGGQRFELNSIDLKTGRSTQVLHETAAIVMRLNQHDYSRPNVHVLSHGKEVIWYSERSGYGHLYLYDAVRGELKRQLTGGDWVVSDLLHIDEAKRLAYFSAGPRQGGNPYYRYLYRVSLDGGAPQLLTPEAADHNFNNFFGVFRAGTITGSRISPSGRYFVDSFSTTDQPPRVVIRKTSGELVKEVLRSDAAALHATGWQPPEQIVVKAADGATDLYGSIFKPRTFVASRKYPVIDYMYPGPQGRVAPRSFPDTVMGHAEKAQTFADAGFVVVVVDGRGTASRSRAFRDTFLRTEDAFGAIDHVAAVRNLAAERPYMDLQRVGVMGHSYGGYGSLRAMLLHPDFFKVAVSTVGPGEWYNITHPVSVERVFGVPSESAGAREYYDVASNTRLASRLQGRVLLIYGAIDENVPFTDAMVVFDAFIKADKDIDMLIFPDAPHGAFAQPYAVRRSVQYFVDHLAGTGTAPVKQTE